ncbi:MAG: hypothetical protein JXA83_08200 [Acidimicrobiales bacterium]|nr:hypothetical protein [Acidimicrobiales bacterium]
MAHLRVPRPAWLSRYAGALVVLDAMAMAVATLTAKISWLGIDPEPLAIRSFSIPYWALALVTVPTWVALLGIAGAYDLGPFGTSHRVWRRLVRAGAQLLAVVAVAYYFAHLEQLGRGVLVGLIPLAVVFTVAARVVAGASLEALRRRGRARRTALVMGTVRSVRVLLGHLERQRSAGIEVVGVIELDEDTSAVGADAGGSAYGLDISGTRRGIRFRMAEALDTTRAETMIVTGGLAPGQLRDIAWMLEGTGVELLVVPTPADIEGLRTEIRPVAGLPLLYLDG